MKKLVYFVLAFVVCAVFNQSIRAQQEEVIKAPDVFEVRLPVSVLDKKRNPIPGLSKTDFQILEDGKPQSVTFFSDQNDNPPVYVGVMMDTTQRQSRFFNVRPRNQTAPGFYGQT